MKYYGGCDVGSTYTKAVILDETGKICADTTIRSKINSETSAKLAMEEVLNKVGLKSSQDLAYLIGTGYGRNKVPFADENISEISCHAMGVHVTDPSVKAIIDIGGQDVKGISIDTDGTVKNFAMNDKCAAGTGRFYEAMARSFEMSLPEFSNLSLTAKNVIPITAQCTVFAESEVITLVGEGKPMDEIAAGIQMAVAKRCFVMAKKAGATDAITLTGGCAKNAGLKQAIERVLKLKVIGFTKSMESIPNGFIQMISPILILCFAWTLCGLCRDNGLMVGDFVGGIMEGTGSLAKFLPAVIFIVACFIGFATGTSWGTIGIMVPLVCAVFDWTDQVTLLSIGLAASCAGGVCGDHLSPISDTTIMASAGAHCFHLNHVATQIPYGVTVAAVSFVSFIIAGLVQQVVVCMIIAIVLMIGTLLVIRAVTAKKHKGIFQEMAAADKALYNK